MTNTEQQARELLERARAAISKNDHLTAPDANATAWLIAQLACWPERVDDSCTTNLRFIMTSAAALLLERTHNPDLEGLVERVEAAEPAIEDEKRVIGAARVALNGTEMARTGVTRPANGSRPYSYVTFHGQAVRFDEGEFEANGDAGTARAGEYADKINDGLFELAKSSARLALNGVCAFCGGYPLANPDELDCGRCEIVKQPTPSPLNGDVVEALKPFVTHYQSWMDRYPDDEDMSVFARVTFGDVRRARAVIAALSSLSSGEGSDGN